MLDVGGRRQLMIDYRFIQDQEGIALRVNPPRKLEPAILPDRPWEAHCLAGFGTVMADNGRFRLWYSASPAPGTAIPETLECPQCGASNVTSDLYHRIYRCAACNGDLRAQFPELQAQWQLCQAVSSDGLHWEKLPLGLVDFRGSTDNNIVAIDGAARFEFAALRDPHAPPETRYRVINRDGQGMFLTTSPDGLRWTDQRAYLIANLTADNPNQLLWDARLGKYIAYLRGFPGRRVTVRCELDDPLAVPWPHSPSVEPKIADYYGARYITTELPTVMATDECDPQPCDIMAQSVVLYPDAQDVYLAFPSLYRWYPGPGQAGAGREQHHYYQGLNDGPLEVQLFVSRDGIHWDRPERSAYVPLGLAGTKDGGCIYNMLTGMLRVGDTLYQYYTAREVTHAPAAYRDPRMPRLGMIGIVEQPLDRFVAAEARAAGRFLSPPFVFRGRHLELNIDCGALGEAWVELRDGANRTIPGFALTDCDPIDRNHLRFRVTWRGRADLGTLAGMPIRLLVKLRTARLYAFQFVAGQAA